MVEETSDSNALKIRGREIRKDENGLVCLNDIWRSAGFTKNRRPGHWQALVTTNPRIIKVLSLITRKSGNYTKADMRQVLRTRRGADGGTYAHALLALDYAEYLNPTLAIEVKEVFLRFKAADPALADDIMDRSSAEANEWMAKRSMARSARLGYTAALKSHGVEKPTEYAICTNETYQGLYGQTARQLMKSKGLAKGQKLRDEMNIKELATVSFSEVMATDRIDDENCRGFGECRDATGKVARAVRQLIDDDMKDRQRRLC